MISKHLCRIPAIAMILLFQACSGAPDKIPDLIETADSLIGKGVHQYNIAEYDKAESLFYKALYQYRAIDNPEGIASSCLNLAKTELSRGKPDKAGVWLEMSRTLVGQYGITGYESRIAIIESSLAIETGDYAAAISLLEPLIANTSTDRLTRLAAVQNRTRSAFALNLDTQQWVDAYADMVSPGVNPESARLSRFKAQLQTDPDLADSHYQAALDIYRELAYRPGIAATLTEWAVSDMNNNDYGSARNRLERALYIRADLLDTQNSLVVLGYLADTAASLNNRELETSCRYWITQLEIDPFINWGPMVDSLSSYPKLQQ